MFASFWHFKFIKIQETEREVWGKEKKQYKGETVKKEKGKKQEYHWAFFSFRKFTCFFTSLWTCLFIPQCFIFTLFHRGKYALEMMVKYRPHFARKFVKCRLHLTRKRRDCAIGSSVQRSAVIYTFYIHLTIQNGKLKSN